MIPEKHLKGILLVFLILAIVLAPGVIITPVPAESQSDHGNLSDVRYSGSGGSRSGEVEHPVVRSPATVTTARIAPLIASEGIQETPARTPIPSPVVSPPTPAPQPVVTVTVFVYPSGPSYSPVYYYPPGYAYPVTSYYPSGSLTVTSSPSNAIIIIDGYTTQTTPYVFTNMVAGYHTVEIDYPGYEAYVTSVYIDNGASPTINADLVPLRTYGSLFVDSTPQGADVYVDGNFEGSSPVTVSGLSAGPHMVELHSAGYEVLTQTVDIVSGQGTNLNLVLTPYSASSDTGSIDVSSNQPGALVYLDGIYKGSTSTGKTFNIIAVTPGYHTIFLSIPGFPDFTRTVQVNAGQISHIDAQFSSPSSAAQLSPMAAGDQTGSIVVTSIPSGGQVYVDDKFRGVAPLTIYNVAAGSHIVNMNLAGYSDYSTTVDVTPGQVAGVSATFTPGGKPVTTRAALLPAVTVMALVLMIICVQSSRRRK